MYEYACDRCKKNLGNDYRNKLSVTIELQRDSYSKYTETHRELCHQCHDLLERTLIDYWNYKPAPTVSSGLAEPEFKTSWFDRFWSWMQT